MSCFDSSARQWRGAVLMASCERRSSTKCRFVCSVSNCRGLMWKRLGQRCATRLVHVLVFRREPLTTLDV